MSVRQPEGTSTVLRVTTDHTRARDWSLVLASGGIPYRLDERPWGLELSVESGQAALAAGALATFDREAVDAERRVLPAAPDRGPSLAGLGVGVALLGAFAAVGGRDGATPSPAFADGAAVAERILGGEPWRAVTALTLHADVAHVTGNAVAAFIFVGALGRWLGTGSALLLTVLGGALGNLLTALAYQSGHSSVGASTATFAALGALGALQIVRRARPTGRRGVWAALGATLGLVAMLGLGSGQIASHIGTSGPRIGGPELASGSRIDVVAHVLGVGAGALLALVATWAGRGRPFRRRLDALLGGAALAVLAIAWRLAVQP